MEKVKINLEWRSALTLALFITDFIFVSGKTNVHSSVADEAASSQNYKEAMFIYPPGIRSERDIPVCTKWVTKVEVEATEFDPETQGDMGHRSKDHEIYGNRTNPLTDVLVTGSSIAQGNPKQLEEGVRWESACNIIHKRFFYPPIVERLCRCPDRTECPWEYVPPPNYPNSLVISSSGTVKGNRDPFTIMLSNRSQAKFCTEVMAVLPRCQNPTKKENKKEQLSASMVKTVRRTTGGDEIPQVTVNCFCPPLHRQWTYVGHTEPNDYGNGTLQTSYYYKCERLPRCRRNDRCGNIRTDLHFSFYHCSCPKQHLCLPRDYPVQSEEDVEEDVNEVLFRGQIAPAYCTQFSQ